MAGQHFVDILVANQRLWVWVREVAGSRCHGTIHQAPWRLFHDQEQVLLLPLPPDPFTLCEIKPVKVHLDCHVTIAGSFYSVPYTYIGQTIHAYIGERVVHLFCQQTFVATHLRSDKPGLWSTRLDHYPADKAAYLERTPERYRHLAARIGPATQQVVQTLLAERPLGCLRSVQAILRLEKTVGPIRLEAVCARAVYVGDVRYRRIPQCCPGS